MVSRTRATVLTAGTLTGIAAIIAAVAQLSGVFMHPSQNNQNQHVSVQPIAKATADQEVKGRETVFLYGAGSSDPDGKVLYYRWEQIGGTHVNIDSPDISNPTFIAPVLTHDETLSFKLTVTDNTGLDSIPASVSIKVDAVNPSLMANAGQDQIVNEGTTVILNGNASTSTDAGNIVSYSWVQTSGPKISLKGNNTVTPIFKAPAVDTDTPLTFELTVKDKQDRISGDTVNILVKSVHRVSSSVNQPLQNTTVNKQPSDQVSLMHAALFIPPEKRAAGQENLNHIVVIWVDAPPEVLSLIQFVLYYPLPSKFFNPSEVPETSAKDKFAASWTVWEKFEIQAKIYFKTGDIKQLSRFIYFPAEGNVIPQNVR
jgi:hypothetical protein